MKAMQATRRRFMAFVGAAPIAGREVAARALSGISGSGLGLPASFPGELKDAMGITDGPAAVAGTPIDGYGAARKLRELALRAALSNKAARGEVEAILYQDNRIISAIDPDLATLRSYSLMAKVTFQRQRNVARAIEFSLLDCSPYQQMRVWGDRILSLAGIKI